MAVIPKELVEVFNAPMEGYKNKPAEILNTIGFYCEADFEIKPEIMSALKANVAGLAQVDPQTLREGFERVISSKKAGPGLSLLIEIGAMDYIIGPEVAQHMSRAEISHLNGYIENIDKTLQTHLRRLALFYCCFEPKKGEKAISHLAYTEEELVHLHDAVHMIDRLYFLTNKYEYKKFLVKYGMERYEFLHNLSKAQRIVYDLPVNRVESRDYLYNNIREWNEPIFEEDMAITRDQLREYGCKEEDLDKVMRGLLDLVHIMPKFNNRHDLEDYGRKYSKHPWRMMFKKLKYIK